jgi:tetratricopeptide (TPR) repeat protein
MSFEMSSHAATPLQAARLEIGWKQTQTIHALRRAADEEGLPVATAQSLKTMLSRWENGQECRDSQYQRLFCRVYGRTPDELGFLREDPEAVVLPRVAPAVGPEMVEYFRNVFTEHLRADNLMGPHHLVDVVRAQSALLDHMLPSSRGDVRQELLMLAFRYNEFAGWLYQDACNPEHAMRYTDRSMEYALEIGELREISYVLMRKADIAADLDNPDRVIGLTEAALRDPSRVLPRIRALILRLRGRAYARRGSTGECARALDTAYEDVLRPYDAPDDLTAYCTPAYIGMEAANCWSKLGRFDSAIATYERSLQAWPIPLRRDQGLCLARLATAYAGREDIEQACTTGRQAVDVVRSATSSRALNELQRVRVRLAPWRRHAEVSDLSDRIRGLIQPAA